MPNDYAEVAKRRKVLPIAEEMQWMQNRTKLDAKDMARRKADSENEKWESETTPTPPAKGLSRT